MNTDDSPRTVQAVQITIDIIEYLQGVESAGITELATETGRSKGTIHSHVTTLVQNHYLTREEDQYRLSLRYLELGETVKNRVGFYEVVRDELNELATESSELCQFAQEEHGQLVYLYKARGEKAVESASSIGKREYLHCVSLGKAIMAHLPQRRVDTIIEQYGLPQYTPQTITSKTEIRDELQEIRDKGYAIDNEEKITGLKCVAAPVIDSTGHVFGAVSISGPSSRMTGERFSKEFPDLVKRSANVIEINSQFS
jgi:DNA-binding IclR family transcriptional regulator